MECLIWSEMLKRLLHMDYLCCIKCGYITVFPYKNPDPIKQLDPDNGTSSKTNITLAVMLLPFYGVNRMQLRLSDRPQQDKCPTSEKCWL